MSKKTKKTKNRKNSQETDINKKGKFNKSNFHISKFLPVTFFKNCFKENIYIGSFLSLFGGAVGVQTFLSTSTTDYQVLSEPDSVSTARIMDALSNNVCGTELNWFSSSVFWEQIASWPQEAVTLWRGLGQLPLPEVEACLENVLEEALAEKTSSSTMLFLWGLLGLAGLTALITLYGIITTRSRLNEIDRDLENSQEEQDLTSASPSVIVFGENLDKSTTPINRETFTERLTKIGIKDLTNYPEANHFIDPISFELMEHPVIANDGNTYDERSLLEFKKLTPNANCPKNPSVPLTSWLPNNNLKAQIVEFVEAQEKKAKLNLNFFTSTPNAQEKTPELETRKYTFRTP